VDDFDWRRKPVDIPEQIPEPSSALLLLTGLAILVFFMSWPRHRRRTQP